jgi:uncharacterized protein (DUF924 family)
MTPETIIAFWQRSGEAKWFAKDAGFDAECSIRFRQALAEARDGAFADWAETPRGALALIILLDQLARNIHRGNALAFAGDRRALALAIHSVGRGFHQRMPAPEAMWFIMPFEHAEDMDAQMRCIALFTSMGLTDLIPWAKLHLDIIARFGRFPHRNAIFGRVSTPEEIAFLKAGGFAG